MTREEAIELIHDIQTDAVYSIIPEEKEALDMAISALSVPEREKGIENYDKLMTINQQLAFENEELRERLSAVPEREKGEWIPVGWIPNGRCGYPSPEEEYKHFLTIDNKGEMTVQKFLLSLDEEPMPYFSGMRDIVAWQPLPEPYKEGGE